MAKLIFEHELESMYSDFLDECYGTIKICGLKYSASHALKEVDPVAFRYGFVDWLDAEVSDERLFYSDGEYYDADPNEGREHA